MPTFSLKKRFTFEAAHYLPLHQGKCQRLHGHSWNGWVEVVGNELQADGPQAGMLMDYGCLTEAIRPMVEKYLDHYCLNETLQMQSPTSEAVAQWIFRHLRGAQFPVTSVTIEETCTSVCNYSE
jgi:6-pyruvoyltetrahydropterin/6-carboxytetrahydropterin synthase